MEVLASEAFVDLTLSSEGEHLSLREMNISENQSDMGRLAERSGPVIVRQTDWEGQERAHLHISLHILFRSVS